MTISVHSFLALLLVTSTMACTRISNSISDLKLECGDEVDISQSYIKVLDQKGQIVRSEDLEIRALSSPQQNGQPQLTSKGCLQRPTQGSFAIVGQGPLKSQGFVLSPSHGQDTVTLRDISRWKLQVDCREPTPTQGTIKLQLIWDNTLIDRVPMSVALASKPEVELPVSWDNSSVTVQVDGTEGPFALDLHWNDPFHETAVQSTRCQYVLDKTAPKVTASLPEHSSSGSFRVNAGSLVKFTAEDLHLDSISYCIRKESEECTTRVSMSEVTFQAPSSGRWCARYWATDRAGNQSGAVEKCGVSFQEDRLSSLSNALSVLQNSGLNSLQNAVAALRAVKAYVSLDTDEERESIQGKVRDMLLSLGSQLFLHGSTPVRQDERWELTFAKGENWISMDSHGVGRERDPAGKLLHQYDIDGASSQPRASLKDGQILNIDGDAIKVWTLQAGHTQEKTVARLQGKNLGAIFWNPVYDEFLVQEARIRDASDSPLHIFRWDASTETYSESQIVPLAPTISDVTPISWSFDGNYLLMKGFGRLQVFKRISEGNYQLLEAHEAEDGRFIGAGFDTNLLLYQGGSSLQYKNLEKDQTFRPVVFGIKLRRGSLSESITLSDRELLVVENDSKTLHVLNLESSRLEFTAILPDFKLDSEFELKWYPQEHILSVLSAKDLVLLRKAPQPSLREDPNVSKLNSWRILQRIRHADENPACQTGNLQVHHHASRSFIKSCGLLKVWGDDPLLGEAVTFQNVPADITPNPAEKYAFGPLWWIQGQKIWDASRLWRGMGLAAVVRSEQHDRIGLVMKNGIPVVFKSSGELVGELGPLTRLSDFNLAHPIFTVQQPHLMTFQSAGRIVTWQPDHRVVNVWQEGEGTIRHVSVIDVSKISPEHAVLRFFELPSGDIGLLSGGALFMLHQGQLIDIANTFRFNALDALALSPTGRVLAVANDTEIKIYTWRDGRGYELESTIQTGFKIVSLQWDPKGEILAGRLETSKAYFWRFTDRRLSLIKSIVYEGKSADGYWTADGERFIINAGSPTLILNRQIQIVNTLHLKQGFSWTALKPDGTQMLIYSSQVEKGSEGHFHLLPTDIGILRGQLCDRLKTFLTGEIPTSWSDSPDEVKNLCN